jgi:hypothetical protein
MIDDRMISSVHLLGRGLREPRDEAARHSQRADVRDGSSSTTVPIAGIPLRSPWPRICRTSSPTGDQRLMTRARGEVAPR